MWMKNVSFVSLFISQGLKPVAAKFSDVYQWGNARVPYNLATSRVAFDRQQ